MSRIKTLTPNFSKIVIGLASPESILARSCGEVTEPETKNHRTYRSAEGGLFCQRIFGPEESWQCQCGKYKGIKYRIACDQCGVKLDNKKVRRQRTGHIRLAVPMVHTWFFRYHPSSIGGLLGLSAKKLASVIYYASYVVIQPGAKAKEGVLPLDLLSPREYAKHISSLPNNHLLPNSNPDKFIAGMGGEAIKMLLQRIDLEALSKELRDKILNETSQQRRGECIKRLQTVESFLNASKNGIQNKPEWMVLDYIPVMSPAYRPMLRLHNGRCASADFTELLKRMIMRNNRLDKFIKMKVPEIIVLNEMRMLQEIVDAFIDNSPRLNTVVTENGRPFKSISASLKGKSGIFRGSLIAKRVNQSGRSVITLNPHLKLYECGLPKEMALILFEPFLMQRLKCRGLIRTFKEGKKMIDTKSAIVWQVLDLLIKEHPVLLNRAPTLFKCGIQAFYPKLVECKSIQLHPLVCAAFNADFDGDSMAVHVPLSQEAIAEAKLLMLSTKNLFNPSNGEPIVVPNKDMVLGLYYLTKGRKHSESNPVKGTGTCFSNTKEALIAVNNGRVSKHAHVNLRIGKGENRKIIETTAGRIIFNEAVPSGLDFINERIDAKNIGLIVKRIYDTVGEEDTVVFLDTVKELGFQEAHAGGLTFGLDDMKVPKEKKEILKQAEEEVEEIKKSYLMGLITETEQYNQIVDIWTRVNIRIKNVLIEEFKKNGENSLFMMMDSGARGTPDQAKQICGWRGLISNSKGKIIQQPILASIVEGVGSAEYTTAAQGSLKGQADTTLKTAEAGYFTRKLIYAGQSIVVTQKDCQSLRGRILHPIYSNGQLKVALGSQIIGRMAVREIINPKDKSILLKRDVEITKEIAEKIDDLGILAVEVRSPIFCEASDGVCVRCYGRNLGSQRTAIKGDAVGNIAAQAISEPGTQLTLRTFHTGGAVSGEVVEDTVKVLEDGTIQLDNLKTILVEGKRIIINHGSELKVIGAKAQQEIQNYLLPYGASLAVKHEEKVKKGQLLYEWDPYRIPIITAQSGTVIFEDIEKGITYTEEYNAQTGYKERVIVDAYQKTKVPNIIVEAEGGERLSYTIPAKAQLEVEEGDQVKIGAILATIKRPRNTPYDMVGGLPHVTQLFETQGSVSSRAVVSAVDGKISFGARRRGSLEILVTAKDGKIQKHKVLLTKQLLVQEGAYVRAGDMLSDGMLSAKDVLQIKGLNAFCNYFIKEVQEVYQRQGVTIDDRHMEVILLAMLRKVIVISAGDTTLVPDQLISKVEFNKINQEIADKKIVVNGGGTSLEVGALVSAHTLKVANQVAYEKNVAEAVVRSVRPAIAQLKVLGISATALNAESFMSAASFQSSVKVLIRAAIRGQVDRLKHIQENAMVGKLFPAGTGLREYDSLRVSSRKVAQALAADRI